ncbi:hypothetical protein LX36DRAFT_133668 [Colletotrichum falcatum]|nr:hypothetical protein LX36DRAFT_133668 [Colletotrichum falcatum]
MAGLGGAKPNSARLAQTSSHVVCRSLTVSLSATWIRPYYRAIVSPWRREAQGTPGLLYLGPSKSSPQCMTRCYLDPLGRQGALAPTPFPSLSVCVCLPPRGTLQDATDTPRPAFLLLHMNHTPPTIAFSDDSTPFPFFFFSLPPPYPNPRSSCACVSCQSLRKFEPPVDPDSCSAHISVASPPPPPIAVVAAALSLKHPRDRL